MSEEYRRILVIDDDIVVRQSIVAYLEDSGFIVKSAADGQAGMDMLKSSSPDVVITDLRMPDFDGLDVLNAVRKWKPNIPVIVVSGMGVVRDVVDALRAGASDYLVKPLVDMEILVHAIKRSLEKVILQEQNLGYRAELERANRELREAVRVLERDQRAGREVQSKFMPESPAVIGGYQFEFEIIPSLYLSGDFIDYGLVGDRFIVVSLIDVSGHGSASAFVTIWLKQLAYRYFKDDKLFQSEDSFKNDIPQLIRQINDRIINSDLGCHLTCFVGVIDTHTARMHYCLAGHLPFPIIITGGQTRYLSGKGKPVGIFENVTWDCYSIELPEDFTLIAFSDGVLEILEENELIDKEAALLNKMTADITDITDIRTRLNLNSSETVPDDVAILKIQVEKK